MNHIEKQMRAKNCPNLDDSPFSSFQEPDHEEKPKLISQKGGGAKLVKTEVFCKPLTKRRNS